AAADGPGAAQVAPARAVGEEVVRGGLLVGRYVAQGAGVIEQQVQGVAGQEGVGGPGGGHAVGAGGEIGEDPDRVLVAGSGGRNGAVAPVAKAGDREEPRAGDERGVAVIDDSGRGVVAPQLGAAETFVSGEEQVVPGDGQVGRVGTPAAGAD